MNRDAASNLAVNHIFTAIFTAIHVDVAVSDVQGDVPYYPARANGVPGVPVIQGAASGDDHLPLSLPIGRIDMQ